MAKSKQYSAYFSSRTAGFLNQLSREYIRKGGQSVLYYKLDAEMTDYGDDYERIHREASVKKFLEPQKIECMVYIDPKTTENFRDVGYELRTYINVFVERDLLVKLNIKPDIGDRVSFQDQFFEVYDTDDSLMYHGNPLFQYSIKLDCIDIRINNNEDDLKSDKDYYLDDLNRNEPRELPDSPDGYTELLSDATVIKDDNSLINTFYTDDYQTLNADIKLQIDSNEIEIADQVLNGGLFLVYDHKSKTVSIKPEASDLTGTVEVEISTESEQQYINISLVFNVNHPDFHKVDKIVNILNKDSVEGVFLFAN